MKPRASLILVAIAVVVFGLGLYFGTGNQGQPQPPAARLAFPGLADQLAQTATLDIAQAGKDLRIDRKGATWVLPGKGGYPAKDQHVHQLLTGLAELKLDEPRTSDPSQYSRLGVEDTAKTPAKGTADSGGATLVRVLDAKGAAIAQLIVGHTHVTSGGTGESLYVRRPGEAQSWLADGQLVAETDPNDWLDQSILNIPATQIAAVTVTRGGETLQFARAGGKFGLQTPADHPKLDDSKVDDVGGALDSLTLNDVRAAPAPGTQEGQAVFTTTGGMQITATISKDGSKDGAKVWATFAVTGEGKAKPAADTLAAKVKGWAYQLGSWKEVALVPTLTDLEAAVEAAAPAPTAAPAAATPAAK